MINKTNCTFRVILIWYCFPPAVTNYYLVICFIKMFTFKIPFVNVETKANKSSGFFFSIIVTR